MRGLFDSRFARGFTADRHHLLPPLPVVHPQLPSYPNSSLNSLPLAFGMVFTEGGRVGAAGEGKEQKEGKEGKEEGSRVVKTQRSCDFFVNRPMIV